jgi:hypothetical protein
MRALYKAAALVAVAALAACALRQGAPKNGTTPGQIDATVVHAGRVNEALRLVAASSLSKSDRAAFAAFMTQNRNRPESYDGQTVRRIINYQRAYRLALKTAADSAAEERAHRAGLATLITISPRAIADRDGAITIELSIRNKTKKTISYAGAELIVEDAAGSRTIGTTELRFHEVIAPHASRLEKRIVRYASFESGNSTMMDAGGARKRVRAEVLERNYSDGSSARANETHYIKKEGQRLLPQALTWPCALGYCPERAASSTYM